MRCKYFKSPFFLEDFKSNSLKRIKLSLFKYRSVKFLCVPERYAHNNFVVQACFIMRFFVFSKCWKKIYCSTFMFFEQLAWSDGHWKSSIFFTWTKPRFSVVTHFSRRLNILNSSKYMWSLIFIITCYKTFARQNNICWNGVTSSLWFITKQTLAMLKILI